MLGAISLLLGAKADRNAIRTGCSSAEISGVFSSISPDAAAWAEEHGIELEDGALLIRRLIRVTGRSAYTVNGSPVTVKEGEELGHLLVDVSSQHSHQMLLRPGVLRALLDEAAGTEAEKEALFALGTAAPVLWSANYSLGVAVLSRALRVIAPVLGPDFDIEITETHHNQKADAPSGTAKLLLEAVDPEHRLRPVYGREGSCGRREKDEVGIHALRGGTVAGTHTVHFFGPDEELELTHRAASRRIFVSGALKMARLLPEKPNGVYDLQNILFGE